MLRVRTQMREVETVPAHMLTVQESRVKVKVQHEFQSRIEDPSLVVNFSKEKRRVMREDFNLIHLTACHEETHF